jgi:hypothetical protein
MKRQLLESAIPEENKPLINGFMEIKVLELKFVEVQ